MFLVFHWRTQADSDVSKGSYCPKGEKSLRCSGVLVFDSRFMFPFPFIDQSLWIVPEQLRTLDIRKPINGCCRSP